MIGRLYDAGTQHTGVGVDLERVREKQDAIVMAWSALQGAKTGQRIPRP